ncbi:hypothetical protein IV203_025199 [Nitzschia inconspicua]|uniref:Uncharacterized protein n=1 Tax=Nitzschia inconspicua TaxID=303405 RepID=A0A9K3K9U8_9STRA|nr:hypothetical protein IV203_037001 [Nitzschia inconspicua]KAG7339606.1 hypothetical protein IV203_025199 [Nitzschia inconspicua]
MVYVFSCVWWKGFFEPALETHYINHQLATDNQAIARFEESLSRVCSTTRIAGRTGRRHKNKQGLDNCQTKVKPVLQAFLSQIESSVSNTAANQQRQQGGHTADYVIVVFDDLSMVNEVIWTGNEPKVADH